MPHLICSGDLLSPRPLPPSSHQLYWDLCSVLSNLVCCLEFCGCFFAAKELWSQGTAEVICSHSTPSSCRKLEPLSCSPCPRLPHSNCILPYGPPASLCQCRAALFVPWFLQQYGMGLTVLRIPLAHSVFCPSQVSRMIPSAPKSRDHIMQFLGVPWIPCSLGALNV